MPAPPQGRHASAPRFLIADRDPLVREECRRCLAARGFEVYVAADALQCLEQLREHAPSVLVLDPHIAWGGGDGVLEWLQDEAPLHSLVVYLFDGQSAGSVPDRLRRLVAGQLQRPCGLHDLFQLVNRLEDELCFADVPVPSLAAHDAEGSLP
jgi:DNA-binding NarL/FixJ family response regulator